MHNGTNDDSGDSYSTTGFNASTGPQPNASNPLGNPPYPGYTSSNGPNWVDYLTVQDNSSLILTYNLAYGGATVDSNLAQPYLPTVLSFEQQVQEEFLPLYTGPDASAVWNPSASLFAFWFGINDVGNTYSQVTPDEYQSTYNAIFQQYDLQLQALQAAGAKSFLFLNVPPVQRSPLTQTQGLNASEAEFQAITIFNEGLIEIAEGVLERDITSKVFLFDAYDLFSAILDDPQAFPGTANLKNTSTYCPAYENGTTSMTSFNSQCSAPVNEYFWLNTLHPTYPVHEVLANQLAQMLGLHK